MPKHCQILRSQHWTEIVGDFISPQQDSVALANLDAEIASLQTKKKENFIQKQKNNLSQTLKNVKGFFKV